MEVLIGVMITTVVGGAAAAALTVGIRNLDDQNARLAGSNDTQFIAAYLTSDVASAETISTTGTTAHAAPGVSPTVTGTKMVSFWALKSATTLALPDGMTVGWNVAHVSTPTFRIGMAEESTPGLGGTGNRIATSALGTSSINHSVAVAPASASAMTRRTPKTGTTATAPQLSVEKPTATASGDRLLAHVVVAGGNATTVTAPAGWAQVSARNSGTTIKSVIFQKLATSADAAASTVNYTFGFRNAAGPVVREAAIGIVAYSSVSTTEPLNQNLTDASPCGGETPVLLLSWWDRHADPSEDLAIQVAYIASEVRSQTHLLRARCTALTGVDMTGQPASEQTLATNLAPATAFASCVSSSAALATTSTSTATATNSCLYLPVTVTLSLTEPPEQRETSGRTYLLRATTRTDREVEA